MIFRYASIRAYDLFELGAFAMVSWAIQNLLGGKGRHGWLEGNDRSRGLT